MRERDPGFASETYLAAKAMWGGARHPRRSRWRGGRDAATTAPFSGGRDPRPLSSILAVAAEDLGWATELAQAQVINDWPELVGEAIAPHTRVTELRDGVLYVQCDSTTWATELRRMRAEILSRILEAHADAEVRDLRFLAPGTPSWRYGARVVRGRGPRDTYG